MKCCVRNCVNETRKKTKRQDTSDHFHLFPREPTIRKAWMEALGLTESEFSEKSVVCSEHFYSQDIFETRCGQSKVKDGAIPLSILDEETQLETPATFTVCRVCLTTEGKMYNIREDKLETVYQQISGTVISGDDKLPQKLCWECVHRLLTHAKFKDKVARSQNLMVDLLKTRHFLTVKDIKTIDRTTSLLKSTLINKLYNSIDFDYTHKQPELYVKTESICDEDDLVKTESIHVDSLPIIEVEIKNEESNDFYEETHNTYDSEDDVKLSEVVKPKKIKKVKTGVKRKVIKKHHVAKEEGVEAPDTVHAFMETYVKRRRANDNLEESLFTVSVLSYDEQIAEVERRQESTTFKNSAYKCTICYRGFHIKDRYDSHIIRHNEKTGAFECFICKTRLKSARALRKHITAQHTEMYSCKGCPFTTKNRGVAKEHAKWHSGTKYQCPNCPSEFDKLTTYLGHIRIKHVSDFVCELCGYTFVSQKGIDIHKKKKHRISEKTAELEGPYCEVCDVRFLSEEAHARHLKVSSKHSSDNDPNRIRNDSQSMGVSRAGRVMRRVERRPLIHSRDANAGAGREPGPITCEQCGIQLRDLRLYAQHFRRAHPDKNRTKYPAMKTPAMCELCGRIFQSMALLKDHMWVHTGEKRFKCDRCDKSFTQKSNLVFHLRTHSGTRPSYECPLCGKHFAFFNNRRRHMFIHTGLKPFKCDTCGKCFTTSGEQRAHVEHVHMKKPWPKRAKGRHDVWQKCDPCED